MPEKGFDLMNSATPPQETPLLDSTPLTPPGAPVAAVLDTTEDSVSSPVKEEMVHHEDDEDEARKRELLHKKSIQGIFLFQNFLSLHTTFVRVYVHLCQITFAEFCT